MSVDGRSLGLRMRFRGCVVDPDSVRARRRSTDAAISSTARKSSRNVTMRTRGLRRHTPEREILPSGVPTGRRYPGMPNSSVGTPRPGRLRPVFAVATVLLLAGLLALPACSSDAAAAATFQREPVDAPTPDPFMPGVGTDKTGVVAPANVKARAYSAKIPGLYGGSGDNAVCDPAALATFLASDDAKATAWAKVLGIGTADIPAYIATLTPVLLRTDTAVTNHGFENGAATSIPAVLQAGTAVLVDDHGVPVVKCGCGNPLTAPPSTDGASFTGTTWKTFEADTVTTVAPAPEPVAALVIANPAGTGVVRPIGTTGDRDTPFDPTTMTGADDPTATTPGRTGPTDDPATTTDDDPAVKVPGSADGGAADDGSGPSADSPTDDASNAENPDGSTPSDTKPTGSSTQSYTFSGTTVPGAECGVASAPVDVQVTGSGSGRQITLPSASGQGFAGLVFAVNPDGSIDADTTYAPPGAAGLVVTYRFQGQLTINDPPTPSTVTGTLSVSGSGIPRLRRAVRHERSDRADAGLERSCARDEQRHDVRRHLRHGEQRRRPGWHGDEWVCAGALPRHSVLHHDPRARGRRRR